MATINRGIEERFEMKAVEVQPYISLLIILNKTVAFKANYQVLIEVVSERQ